MKQVTTKEKISKSQSLTDSKIIMFLKDLFRPMLNLIAGFYIPYKVIIEQPCCLLPGRPVIYAANHFCFADGPIMGRITPKRSYLFAGKQTLGSHCLYFILNGVIFVDRKDKEDMAASTGNVLTYLNRLHYYILRAWNLTENQLMLPMKYGIIDVAQKPERRLFPPFWNMTANRKSVLSDSNVRLVFSEEDSKAKAITVLRDIMATVRWEFWERKAFSIARNLISKTEKKLCYSLEEWPNADWEYESSCIFTPHTEPKDTCASRQTNSCKRIFIQKAVLKLIILRRGKVVNFKVKSVSMKNYPQYYLFSWCFYFFSACGEQSRKK